MVLDYMYQEILVCKMLRCIDFRQLIVIMLIKSKMDHSTFYNKGWLGIDERVNQLIDRIIITEQT